MKINLPQNEDLTIKKGNTEYELVSVMNAVAQDLVYFNNINQLLDVILYGE